jgi:hypothetical protein
MNTYVRAYYGMDGGSFPSSCSHAIPHSAGNLFSGKSTKSR